MIIGDSLVILVGLMMMYYPTLKELKTMKAMVMKNFTGKVVH